MAYEEEKRAKRDVNEKLVARGKIIHFVRTEDVNCFTLIRSRWEDFTEIQLSSSFLSDHKTPNVVRIIRDVARSFAGSI